MQRNWSGSVQFSPATVANPTDEAAVARLITDTAARHGRIRVVGNRHSFTPLIATEDTLVSLDEWNGLIEANPAENTATIRSGTTIRSLGPLLLANGLGMENLGDIDVQSLAGAISTGTHGTGATLGNLSTQVEQLTLITADGTKLECSAASDPDLFQAARLSLGLLGVITRVKLRLLPAYRLHLVQRRERLEDCLARLETTGAGNRHFEFYTFPGSEWVLSKSMNPTQDPVRDHPIRSFLNDVVLENVGLNLLSEICRWFPNTCLPISRLAVRLASEYETVQWSHRSFASPRFVKFNEMEYFIPRSSMADCVREIQNCIQRDRHQVHFPIECRMVRADDLWLSPAYQRDSAVIAVHMYKGMEYRRYFDAMESIFRNHRGRPHWGKMHSLRAADLAALYPKWNAFLSLRERLDPNGLFLNDYLRPLFGTGPG